MFISEGIVDDFTRTILNAIGLGVLCAFGYYLLKIWRVLVALPMRLDHLDKCVDSIKAVEQFRYEETMLFRDGMLADRVKQEKEIAELKREYAGLEGYFKGVSGLRIDRPITEIDPKEGAG